MISGCDLEAVLGALNEPGNAAGWGGYQQQKEQVSVKREAASGEEAVAGIRRMVGEDCVVRLAREDEDA